MKKLLINIGCVLTLAIAMSGCKKQLEDYYVDPDKTTDPSIEKLFSSMLDNNRVRPMYWDMRTLKLFHFGIYSQSVGYQNSPAVYQLNYDYIQDFWDDYYTPNNQSLDDPNNPGSGAGVLGQYRTMQRLYKNIPIDERANVDVFMMAGKAVLLDQTSQMVDAFGDMPFSEAGSVDMSNTISNPKFDNQKELYDTILSGLKDVSDWFAAATLNNVAASGFTNQDYIMRGSIDKWRRYVNSLRLRLLMRISYYNEATARAEVEKILINPLQYPLIDGDGIGDNYNPLNTDVLIQQLTNYATNLNNAFTEINAQAAPDYMLNTVMLPVNDPRIPLMFDKFGATINKVFIPNKTYRAMSAQWGSQTQSDSINYFSQVDSTTYRFNSHLPGIMMSAAEVNFLKAEAYERWAISGGTAQASYNLAVRQAIAFAYYLHSTNPTQYEQVTQPSTATVDAFMAQAPIAYTGTTDEKLAKIWTQKWLHFGFLQCGQSWAEYRRTKYPQVTFYPSTTVNSELPPNRLVYPTSETAYNTSYTGAVKDNDNRNAKIFWDVR